MTNNIPLISWENNRNSNRGLGNEDRSQTDEAPPLTVSPEPGSERSQLSFKNLITHWLWECVAVTFSVLGMAAIAIIALNIDGIRISQWHLDLQPSTVISILATACQSSLVFSVAEIIGFSKWFYFKTRSRRLTELAVFDSASRGPLGSLNLLWPGRSGYRPCIAYASASITIMALAMGPFSQQIIKLLDSQVLLTHTNSNVFVANTWDSGYPAQRLLDNALYGAFYRGIYASTNLTNAMDVKCQTGNCTWPIFASLGACSSCQDVTADSIVIDNGNSVEVPGGQTLRFIVPGYATACNELGCGSGNLPVETSLATSTVLPSKQTANILTFALGQLKDAQLDSPLTNLSNWKAFYCSLDFCIKRYRNLAMCNGTIQPYETESVELQFAQSVPLGQTEWGVDLELRQFIPAKTDTEWVNGTRPLPPFYNSTFSIMGSDIDHFGSFIGRQLYFDRVTSQSLQNYDSLGQILSYPADISEVMANVTEIVTIHLRQNNRNSTTAPGSVWQQVTIVEIRWPWLILPVLIVLITAALLVAAILSSKSDISTVRSWKSSSLPFLFHGIRDWSDDEWEALCAGELESIKKMNAMAAKMDVRLYKAVGSGTALTRHDLGVYETPQAVRPTSRQEDEHGASPSLRLSADEPRDSSATPSTLGPEFRIEATEASEQTNDAQPLLSSGNVVGPIEDRGDGNSRGARGI